MRVGIRCRESKASAHLAADARNERVEVRERRRIFVVEVGTGEGRRVDRTWRADHIKLGALCTGITNIQDEIEWQRLLNIQIPHLNIWELVVLVNGVVAEVSGVPEWSFQGEGCKDVRNVAIDFHVRERRLVGKLLNERAVLRACVVDGVCGPHDGVLHRLPGQADVRREVIAIRMDKATRITRTGYRTDLSRLYWCNV